MQGIVKRVNHEKGFGFIKGDNGIEYFFHKSVLKNTKIGGMQPDMSVTFDDEDTERGPRAVDVYLES